MAAFDSVDRDGGVALLTGVSSGIASAVADAVTRPERMSVDGTPIRPAERTR